MLYERHLRAVLLQWVAHYNQARPHASLGPGIPDLPVDRLARPHGHQIPDGQRVIAASIHLVTPGRNPAFSLSSGDLRREFAGWKILYYSESPESGHSRPAAR